VLDYVTPYVKEREAFGEPIAHRQSVAFMVANIAIASTKAGLVLWFFMHLKYEKRIFKLLLFVPIITISIIIVLTFFDIWYR